MCDVDGYTSASMVYKIAKKINPDVNIKYYLHTGKQHGLSDDIKVEKCDLLIIPDAGSNDVEQCKELIESGAVGKILILDHHICDKENPYAIIVNNQMCDYPNKNFCGAGIVQKFIEAIDAEEWTNYAEDTLDMCALGNISDVMDMREFETKYYSDLGLQHIRSKLFKAIIEKQSYSMNGEVNVINVQFYITPLLNAMIRIGSEEEKDLLFRAFIETDEVFKYKKRGETEAIDEDIYTRAARLCSNTKARQGKMVEKSVVALQEMIEDNGLLGNKLLFVDSTACVHPNLTGVVAIKIAEMYNRPTLLLKMRDKIDFLFGGSCRNFDNSPIESLKKVLDSTGKFDFVQGHDNAAGISIYNKDVVDAIKITNKMLKDVDFTKIYKVDFELDYEGLEVNLIKSISDMKHLFGQGVKEPYVMIHNVPIDVENTLTMGKTNNTWKFVDPDQGIAFIKFTCDESDVILQKLQNFDAEGVIATIDVIGRANLNNFKGILTPQITIEAYEEI